MRNDGTPDRWKYLGIIPRDMYYYYINGELIEFNWKIDHFNVLYRHTLYSARTWAEEKKEQLVHRLQWMTYDCAGELLQQEGYILLSRSDRRSMIKWIQNPKYYQNLISEWFIRRDTLTPYDVEIHRLMPKGWWYKDKAFLEDP